MNPLTWMRENQHRMLVFFTVMLMAGFGALGVMSSSVDRAPVQAPEAKPTVRWSRGTATDLQLEEVWRRRLATQFYLQRLFEAVRQQDANYTSDEQLMLFGASSADEPASVRYAESFNILLLAEKSRDLGIQVSDETIDMKLMRFTSGLLSRNDMRAIATEVGRNAGLMSYTDFREVLKREFLARQAYSLGIEESFPRFANPAAAFEYFARINRRFECQVLPINVDDFVKQVTAAPSEAELKQLFTEGQYRYPAFDGSTPGFKIGNRVKLEYFSADLPSLIDSLSASVSAEEVQAEYDRLLADRSPAVYTPPANPLPDLDPSSFPFGLGTDIPLEGPGAGDFDIDLPPLVPPVVPPTGEGGEKSEQGQATETSGGETGETGSDGAGSEAGAGGEAAGSEGGGGDDAADGESATSRASATVGPEVSPQYVTIPAGNRTQEQSATESQQEAGETASETSGTTEQAETEAAQEQAATEVQETQTGEDATQAEQATGGEAAADGTAADEAAAAADDRQPKIRPLAEVERDIRRSLATPKALAQVEAGFEEISKKLRIFRSDFRIHQSSPATEKAPEPIDYPALAAKHGLSFNVSPIVDQPTLAKTPLGQTQNFAGMLFGEFDRRSQDVYVAERVGEDTLVWVTEAFNARSATFDEVRDQVVEFWKRNQARELALADAKAKAGQVAAGQMLKDVFPAATETGAFSWYTNDRFSQNLRVSEVRGTQRVGDDFMEVVTYLAVGATATAFNADRSQVYVVQKTANAGETHEELVQRFLTSSGSFNDYPFQVRSVLQMRGFDAGTKFIEGLRDEYQVNFLE